MWWFWVLIAVCIYLLASCITTVWYIMVPTVKPNKWLDYFCYPAGLAFVFVLYVTGRIK
jgi:uncharacterized BrkB/YihY/UPF0761 family membrane protein